MLNRLISPVRRTSAVGLSQQLSPFLVCYLLSVLVCCCRYCWWQDSMDEQDAVKHFEAVRSSSSVLPYVTKVRLQAPTFSTRVKYRHCCAMAAAAVASNTRSCSCLCLRLVPRCCYTSAVTAAVWQCVYHVGVQRHLLSLSCCILSWLLQEVGAWKPAAPEPSALQQLPPVLALGGAADRIIRPFQVSDWQPASE